MSRRDSRRDFDPASGLTVESDCRTNSDSEPELPCETASATSFSGLDCMGSAAVHCRPGSGRPHWQIKLSDSESAAGGNSEPASTACQCQPERQTGRDVTGMVNRPSRRSGLGGGPGGTPDSA